MTNSYRKFNSIFIGISLLVAVAVWGMSTIPQVSGSMPIVWVFYALIAVITYLVSILGIRFILDGKGSQFLALFFSGIVLKIILAGSLVLFYKKRFDPDNNWIVLPLALIYFVYLFVETLVLVQASNPGTENRKN